MIVKLRLKFLILLATMFVGTTACLAETLEGKIQDSSPNSPLRGAVDRTLSAPLQGGVQRSSLTAPLHSGVQDSRNPPPHGHGDGAATPPQSNMRAAIPNYSAIMRIVQYKQNEITPSVASPLSQAEINGARFRDDVSLERMPLRTAKESDRRPLREDLSDQKPRLVDQSGRPQRSDGALPQRAEIVAPKRPDLASDQPPVRLTADSDDRPRRQFIEVSRAIPVQSHPERVLIHPAPEAASAASALTQPLPDNSHTLDRIQEIPLVDSRKIPNRSQVLLDKKKRIKKIDFEFASKRPPQPQLKPQLSDPIDESLLWDRWYQHVNDLVCTELAKTMPNHGNPAGRNRIHITVWANHRIEARLVEGNNPRFNDAILEAYSSLNGNSDLEFPRGTHRKQNDYETAHIQEIPAITAAFDSKTIHGDRETLVK
jgi:hypothetical protein